MAIDFKAMLGAIAQPKNVEPQPRIVTEERLTMVANNMAARGYKHSETSLAALHAYLQGYGVMLAGDVGTGKTMFFKVLGIPTIDMARLASYNIEELDSLLANYYQSEVVLDDVGAEPLGNNYGVKLEYLAHILADRLRRNKRTHITMNLDEKRFIDRYRDTRLLDRLYELCKPFRFKGDSLRHATIYPIDG